MRLLILSQVYWPDTAATAQILADLGVYMAREGHEVTVLASRRVYEDPKFAYPDFETQQGGVAVHRLPQTAFAKTSTLGRLINFASFNAMLLGRLLRLRARDFDVVLGMTSPPLVSFFGVLVARWKGWKFCYWAMDLQPELAIQAGLIREGSLAARVLDGMGKAVFQRADRILALDRYMADYLLKRGAPRDKVGVCRLWPVAELGHGTRRMENPFRREQGFGDRIVVMYSGNHAVVHPLDTLLEAAEMLKDDERFLFVFIGGGTRVAEVTRWRESHALANIRQLPYRPRSEIHLSLTSADIHAVVMGDGQVGYTHPNKVYGAMALGCPFFYIGPSPSHITDLIAECPGNFAVPHGGGRVLADGLRRFADAGQNHWESIGRNNAAWASIHLNPEALMRATAAEIEGLHQPASR